MKKVIYPDVGNYLIVRRNFKKNCKVYAENKKACWLINFLDGGPRISRACGCFECQWFKLNNERGK